MDSDLNDGSGRRSAPVAWRAMLGVGLALGLTAGLWESGGLQAAELGGGTLYDDILKEYGRREATGMAAALAARLERGETKLDRAPQGGYLPALLRELNIPISSQLLVFSKTSARRQDVSPRTPRALYFSDRAAVAYYPGSAEIELSVTDPALGVAFYRVEGIKEGQPRLRRDDRCLECHLTARTEGVPGWLVRSFRPGGDGEVDPLAGRPTVDHRTPFAERWGGYYVTGTAGALGHRGNLSGPPESNGRMGLTPTAQSNLVDLASLVDVGRYPEPGSDVVALMVLDHQAHALTLLTRLRFEAEAALQAGKGIRAVSATSEAVLRYLLFVDEVPLPGPVRGTSRFAEEFARVGPVDAKGRSLRQLDLQTRLFRHPCSYMIHSEAFDLLPAPVRRHLYRRLWDVLNGEDPSPESRRWTPEQRQAIREIISATKKDLPVEWRL